MIMLIIFMNINNFLHEWNVMAFPDLTGLLSLQKKVQGVGRQEWLNNLARIILQQCQELLNCILRSNDNIHCLLVIA